jgi:hypothetical protein
MKYIYSLFLLSILLLNVNCEKDISPPITLPPITQEGKNTAGFLLDGEVWVPYGECDFFANPCKEIHARYGSPYAGPNEVEILLGREVDEIRTTLRITSQIPIKKIGNYFDSVSIEFLSDNSDINQRSFTKSLNNPEGNFIITRLDTFNNIIAGTVDFTLQNRKGKTIEITDGRFDFEMNACICR